MAHTNFTFQEVPDGNDVVASCQDCDYEVMFIYEEGRVQRLNNGDITQAHAVSRIPPDGLILSVGLGGSKDEPPGGDKPAPILPVKPAAARVKLRGITSDTCAHGKPSGPGGT